VLETERLILREFVGADAPALLELYRQPSVARFLGPPPRSMLEEQANIARHRATYYDERGFGLWAVELREMPGSIVGRCGLLVSEIAGRAEIELSWAVSTQYRGQGLATEAACAVRDYANAVLGQHRLVAAIADANRASIRVAEKLDMSWIVDVEYKSFGRVHVYVWQSADAG
jgi:ribosomal-protein-alanine N-acetyltransferase